MVEIHYRTTWDMEQSAWRFEIMGTTVLMPAEEFTKLVKALGEFKLEPGKLQDLQIKIGGECITIAGVGAANFAQFREYLELCEASYQEWKAAKDKEGDK